MILLKLIVEKYASPKPANPLLFFLIACITVPLSLLKRSNLDIDIWLEKFDCIPYLKEADNALKTIENNLIIDHKNRDNYKKVTYPLYLKTETFINFLKINDSKWDLIKFLNSHSFKTK